MINIATYADNLYMQHACVMIQSLSEVLNTNEYYNIFFFYSDCSDSNLKKANHTFSNLPPNVQVELIETNFGIKSKLKAKKSFVTSSIYDKILIYEDLPKDLNRVLFIDADVIFEKDPSLLYYIDLEGRLLGAVKEKKYLMNKSDHQDLDVVDLESYHQYFNSGVMVIDLQKWLKKDISRTALNFAIDFWHLTKLHDQDALNYAVKGDWLSISPLWNPRGLNRLPETTVKDKVFTNWEIYEKNLSYFVHFSGSDKPWKYLSFHPKKELYLHYLKQTAFSNYCYPDFSFYNFFKKQFLYLKKVKR